MSQILLRAVGIAYHLILLWGFLPKGGITFLQVAILMVTSTLACELMLFLERNIVVLIFLIVVCFMTMTNESRKWNCCVFVLLLVLLINNKYLTIVTYFIIVEITLICSILLLVQIIVFSKDVKVGISYYYIVLGARVDKNGNPSKALVSRLETLRKIISDNDIPIILTGGKAHSKYIEAEYMAQYLIERGISSDRLLLDTTSKNTYENIYNSKTILEKLNLHNKTGTIITSDYHALRSYLVAKKNGLKINVKTSKLAFNIFIKLSINEIYKCFTYWINTDTRNKKKTILIILLLILIEIFI